MARRGAATTAAECPTLAAVSTTDAGVLMQRKQSTVLDWDALPAEVAAALEAAVAGEDVALVRSGRRIGSLQFRSDVLEGTVVEATRAPRGPSAAAPDGVTVVATAMRLSKAARRRLSDEFGAAYIVVDIHEAPPTTDVLLTHPVSPQLLGLLRHQFPSARLVITEIEDEELGVSYGGPVSRLLDAGASAYLPPRPIAELAATVHAYLSQQDLPMLGPAGASDGARAVPVEGSATHRRLGRR